MNEYIEAWINELKTPGERAYAKSQWAFLQELGPLPDPKDYNLSADSAQAIRIKLAGARGSEDTLLDIPGARAFTAR